MSKASKALNRTAGPVVNGEQFPAGYTRKAAEYEQRTSAHKCLACKMGMHFPLCEGMIGGGKTECTCDCCPGRYQITK